MQFIKIFEKRKNSSIIHSGTDELDDDLRILIMKDKFEEYKGKIKEFWNEAYNKKILYFYFFMAILVTFLIELLAGINATDYSNMQGVFFLIGSPYIFICNALIVLFTLSFTLMVRRRLFGIFLVSALWMVFGIANAVLVGIRVTPFIRSDLTMIDSALKIVDKYLSAWQIVGIILLAILIIVLLIIAFIKAPKIDHKISLLKDIITILIIGFLCLGSIQLGRASNLITKKFDNLRKCYFNYGFVYCFTNSVFNMGVDKPDNYNELLVKDISKNNKKAVEEETVKDTPNIIFVQLESFFEVNDLKSVTFSENPISNFEKLMAEYPSGYLTVPVIGAGTVNTEFEVETGMSLENFGSGEIPYNTYLQDYSLESICYNLKPHGYKCHAIHNNDATFYTRYKVFSHLGYDTFDSLETMNISDEDAYNPKNWLKDRYLTNEIIKSLKSTKEKDFIYTITVQSHGKYNPEDYTSKIKVEGIEDESLKNSYEYFADQLYEVDEFVKDLTEQLKEIDEHTIVVFFGDHLPTLDITEEDLENENLFQTPYVIWSNYQNDYFKDKDIYTFQLESTILNALHITDGKINLCHQANLDKDYSEYKDELHVLTYDLTDGDHYADGNESIAYKEIKLQMGIEPIKITNINVASDDKKGIYVYGKNFTTSCRVYLNDSIVETEYIDDSTLFADVDELEDGDVVSIHLVDSRDLEFFEVDNIEYHKDAMEAGRVGEKKAKSKKTKKKKNK